MIYAFWENLRIALVSLRANKMRSLLTTLGIVIGITTVIAIISVIEGLNVAFARELSGLGSKVLYVQKWHWLEHDWELTKKWPDIGDEEYQAIRQDIRESVAATPMLRTVRPVKYRNRKIEGCLITGVGEDFEIVRQYDPSAGRYLNNMDIERGRDAAAIGWDVAEQLFGNENPIGKEIRIAGRSLTVVGVLEKRGDFFDMSLDQTVIVPIGSFRRNFGGKRSLSIAVMPKDADNPDRAVDELRAILRRVRKIPFDKDDNFAINKVDAIRELYEKLTGGLYAAMIGVAAISLLVGGVGIMNIMLVSVTERTKEIGIRKALGAKRSYIMLQFLIEAVVLACVGGLIGVLLGSGAAWLIDKVSPVPAAVKWWSVWLGLGFSAAVGIIFGLFPARRAAKKNPIEALRYE